jgi:glycosyltransferase involved in cell wall biosynthesis
MNNVTVVIPAFRCSETIGVTLESVLNQTCTDFTVLLVMDGPDDMLKNIIHEWISKYDARGRELRLEILPSNLGAAAVRNHAARIVTSEYVAFIDSDDVWTTDYLEKQVRHITSARAKDSNVVLSYSSGIAFQEDRVIRFLLSAPEVKWPEVIWKNGVGSPSGVIVSRSIYDAGVYHDEDFGPLEDWEWYCRVLAYGKSVANPEALYFYRIHANATSSKLGYSHFVCAFMLMRKNAVNIGFAEGIEILALVGATCYSRTANKMGLLFVILGCILGVSKKRNILRTFGNMLPGLASLLYAKRLRKGLSLLPNKNSIPLFLHDSIQRYMG